MIVEYKGEQVDTSRPLKDYDIKLIDEIEKETQVKIPYKGRKIVDPKTGIVRRMGLIPQVDPKTGIIRKVTERSLEDDSIIEYKGIKIDISRPLTEEETILMNEIQTIGQVKIQYKEFDSSIEDDSIIEFKGIKIDLSRSLTDDEKKLLKQMEKELKEKTVTKPSDKNVRIVRRNGINWIYEDKPNNSGIEPETTYNDNSFPIRVNKKIIDRLRTQGKVKKDNRGRELLWNGRAWVIFSMVEYHHENENYLEENESSSHYDSVDNAGYEF